MSRITRTVALVVAFFIATLGGVALVGSASAAPGDKFFVCKYVGTPGVNETLQTGQNPISVSENAIKVQPVVVGAFFADDQGQSYVLVKDTGQPEPSVSQCPPPRGAPGNPPPPVNTPPVKVFVCKFVGKPGVNETLQTGQNPISVSVNATGGAAVGSFFNDAQGRSFVLAIDNGQKVDSSACPIVNKPPVNKPPVVNPPAGLPKSGPPHTGGTGDVNPLNGLIALGLLAAGVGVAAMRFRRATGASQSS